MSSSKRPSDDPNAPGRLDAIVTLYWDFDDNKSVSVLMNDENHLLTRLEEAFQVTLYHRGNAFMITGQDAQAHQGMKILKRFYQDIKSGKLLDDAAIQAAIDQEKYPQDFFEEKAAADPETNPKTLDKSPYLPHLPKIQGQTPGQIEYLKCLKAHDMVFCLGPAGSGKTFLAVAMGISMLLSAQVKRLILSRPIVEAGENLGYLPGNFQEKVDPYVRPLFDAMDHLVGSSKVAGLIASGDIEIAPLAFMRGRTLSDAYVILDEAQNTTPEQMKMFLTRLGAGSRMVITGDPTQGDLPPRTPSGFTHALAVVRGISQVACHHLTSSDIVRHDLVGKILRAYDAFGQTAKE